MNRLTNEQRLQIIEFYYQNAGSVKKVHCALLPFYVQFKRPTLKRLFGLLWLNFAPNLHCRTLNQQHAYVECELKKLMQLYQTVLMMTINYRFVAVRSNWAGPLLNNVGNFSKGFRCEAFQNTAGAIIEAEWPTTTQNFWWMGSWKVGRRSPFLLKNCVQRRSSFLAQWVRK